MARAHDRPSRSAEGFTLIELMVVMAIIGTLLFTLLPAVQWVREAARRLQCRNNLRQVALATLAYEHNRGTLPPGGLYAQSDLDILNHNPYHEIDLRSGPMISWAVLVLPHLDQEPLFARFDLTKSVLSQPGDPQAFQLAAMLCPSDSARGRIFRDYELTAGRPFGKGNYAAYCSPFHTDLQFQYPGAISGYGRPLTKITDGTTTTLMLAEIRTRADPQDQRGAWALPWTGASLLAFDVHAVNGATTPYRFVPNLHSIGVTQWPNCQGPNTDMLYAASDLPGAQLERMPCNAWTSSWTPMHYLSAAPRSRHPGGVNVAFVDGHVDFLANPIDELTMLRLVSINDGQPVGPPWPTR